VGAETHNDGWIKAVASAPETTVLRKVWRPEGDSSILRTVGAELCKAITDGATEKGLFWIKWLFEEESRLKKEVKGASLSNYERGMPGSKQKAGVGFFILALYAETYKEFASKGLARMHEEFQTLMDLWRGAKDIQGAAKKQILTVLTQILCEVPRWKVPAAQPLIKDPTVMSRAVQQSVRFFQEILVKPRVNSIMPKDVTGGASTKKSKALLVTGAKTDSSEDKMRLMDEMVMAFIQR
jgi:hypothetical protein